jgi:hypothetical protein
MTNTPRQQPPLSTAEVRRRSGQAPTVDAFTVLDRDSLLTAAIRHGCPRQTPAQHCCTDLRDDGYGCDRPMWHDGPHVAYDSDGPVAVWPQEDR